MLTAGPVVQSELSSFLMEITSFIFGKKDDKKEDGWLLDVIKDQTGMKGTGGPSHTSPVVPFACMKGPAANEMQASHHLMARQYNAAFA